MVRIGLLTDVHHADRPPQGGRVFRDARAKVAQAAETFRQKRVDFVVHLGDLVDCAADRDPARQGFFVAEMAALLESAAPERHYVLGNHCLKSLTKGQFLGLVGQRRSYYSFDRGGVHFVVLDACFRRDGADYRCGRYHWADTDIPAAERDWLAKDLACNDRPTVVFSHHRLDRPREARFAAASAPEIRRILAESGNVQMVLMGHSHVNDRQTIDGISYVALQALVEGAGLENNAFSILHVGGRRPPHLHGFGGHARHPGCSRAAR